jgi:hypothetical protein
MYVIAPQDDLHCGRYKSSFPAATEIANKTAAARFQHWLARLDRFELLSRRCVVKSSMHHSLLDLNIGLRSNFGEQPRQSCLPRGPVEGIGCSLELYAVEQAIDVAATVSAAITKAA